MIGLAKHSKFTDVAFRRMVANRNNSEIMIQRSQNTSMQQKYYIEQECAWTKRNQAIKSFLNELSEHILWDENANIRNSEWFPRCNKLVHTAGEISLLLAMSVLPLIEKNTTKQDIIKDGMQRSIRDMGEYVANRDIKKFVEEISYFTVFIVDVCFLLPSEYAEKKFLYAQKQSDAIDQKNTKQDAMINNHEYFSPQETNSVKITEEIWFITLQKLLSDNLLSNNKDAIINSLSKLWLEIFPFPANWLLDETKKIQFKKIRSIMLNGEPKGIIKLSELLETFSFPV